MTSRFRWFFSETKRRSPPLAILIVVQLIYIAISCVGFLVDSRTIKNGVSPWLKPIIFDSSVIIYALSMIWVLSELPKNLNLKFSKQMAISLFIVTTFIGVQSIRGVKTVFNISDPVNSTIFAIFGMAIAWNTYLLFRTALYMSRDTNLKIPPLYKRGLVLGLYSICIGSLIGHAVYFASIHFNLLVRIPSSVERLPSLTLESRLGSLRIAHSLGLHGLQIFMILGAILQRFDKSVSDKISLKTLNLLFAMMMISMAAMVIWAAFGIPLFAETRN